MHCAVQLVYSFFFASVNVQFLQLEINMGKLRLTLLVLGDWPNLILVNTFSLLKFMLQVATILGNVFVN